MKHLIRSGSDHPPLLINLNSNNDKVNNPLKLLNIWINKESFKELIKQNRKTNFEGNPFMVFQHKMYKVKIANSMEQETFGNVFQEIFTLEYTIKVMETKFETNSTVENRESLDREQAKFMRYLHVKEEF